MKLGPGLVKSITAKWLHLVSSLFDVNLMMVVMFPKMFSLKSFKGTISSQSTGHGIRVPVVD